MFLVAMIGFWMVVGMAFFGWRRLVNGKELRVPHVLPPPNGRRRVN